jgi:hypothetical protein
MILLLSSIQIKGILSNNIVIELGPYPQNTKSNSTSIIWQTNIKTANNSVHFGLNPDCNTIINQYNNTDYHIILIDNLQPNQKYYYKVISDGFISDVYNFHTFYEENETIKFIAYGDTRGVWDNWKNASIIAEAIEGEQPYFILHTGDLVNDGRNQKQWIDFFTISNFLHNCTLYPVIGNHEYYGESYFKYFIIPEDGYWYSFDNGPIHFIGLDSNKKNRYNSNQTLWLIKDLINNDKPYTIVFFHHPPYSSGSHGSTYSLRFLWSPLFSFFNIDIVFNGHDHCYERGRVNNVNYIVTGGGGAPSYKVKDKWWTIYSESTYHYCLINAEKNILSFQAKTSDGIIIDNFSIEK